jgi:thiamine-phosphate pyrophosphorylase
MDRRRIFRVLDANFNRAREALRVLEDLFRLGGDDAPHARRLKALRHGLNDFESELGLGGGELSAFRDAGSDVGRAAPAKPYGSREELARANARRLQEALRVLEEFGRLLGRNTSIASRARFEAYEMESLAVPGGDLRARLDGCRLMVLVGGNVGPGDLPGLADAALRGGADVIQLRAFPGPDSLLLKTARRVGELCGERDGLFIVNDRTDIALACDADGVHLGQGDLPIERARAILGTSRLIGASTHSREELASSGASDFPSPLKPDLEPIGPSAAADLFRASAKPAFPIGGIHQGNIAELIGAGIYRAAVSSAVCRAHDPRSAARALKDALESVDRA